ncbi:MAG TPA: DAK2 domain-containing protein [Candidatus Saccharimonadales bacterium]|nr:DAK2 domain-containing protein [Candidatus Saccharimonadales bacterium]
MTRHSCDGPGLLAAFRAAVANLEAHVAEIDDMNVYPVPDGDTGTNMLATARAALEEAERVGEPTADRIASAISFGALMGARGNSGVITSQIFRGMAEGFGGKRRFNGLDLAHALRIGADTAYAAVLKPVEGTILTVVRDAAEAAVEAAERTNDLEAVLATVVDAVRHSVARTPVLLPILHESGVVDAGGQGLFRLFQGALRHINHVGPIAPEAASRPSTLVAHADEGFGYETMFLLQPRTGGGGAGLDLDAIRDGLLAIGESVLVAGDAHAVKVHVHSERPDEVLAFGLGLGTLSRISVENLDAQARDLRERHAAEFTGRHSGVAREGARLAVIAVVAGDGLAACFESFGCSAVVPGGQSSNPSTGELLAAVEATGAAAVLLLPNNPNVTLAARQAAALAGREVLVVPTRNAAEGIAALLSLDPTADARTNAAAMTEAAAAIQTLHVTKAVRDARVGGRNVHRGQTIVLDPVDGLVSVDGDRTKGVLAGIESLRPGFGLLTIYYGDGADLAEAEGLSRSIANRWPALEIEIVHGGQPHDRYLLAAE